MAIALVAHTGAASSNSNTVTTGAIDTTGANLLVEAIGYYSSGTLGTVGDSKSNSYTDLTPGGSNPAAKFAYKKNGTVGSGHTFGVSGGTGAFPVLCAAAFSGVLATGGADAENGNSATGTSIQAGSVTPSVDGCLVLAFVSLPNGITATIDSGFTIIENFTGDGATHFGGRLAYKIQTTAAAVNPTWTLSGSAAAAAVIAVFKPTVPVTITSTTLTDVTAGVSYSETLSTTGGSGTKAWSISAGSLPPGFAINSSTGEITGEVDYLYIGETYDFTVKVVDSSGSDTQAFTLTVLDPLADLGDQLSLRGLEIEGYVLKSERLTADFGSGYGEAASTGTGSGLWNWTLSSEVQPDDDAYGELINGIPAFQYYEQFYRDHTEGDSSEIFIVEFRGKFYHASFANDEVSGDMLTHDLFSMSGVNLKMRRLPGTIYDDDGSIFQPGLWIRADKITGKSDGDTLTTWPGYLGTADWTVNNDGTAPTYETNEVNTLPVVRLTDGDATSVDSVAFTDIFLVMKVREATFSADRGVLGAVGADDWLRGGNGTTKFQDLGVSGMEYRLNGTLYAAGDQQAPMNAFGVVHVRQTAATFDCPDGLLVGQDGGGIAGKIDLAEVIACTTQPSAALFGRITNVLKSRYGIS